MFDIFIIIYRNATMLKCKSLRVLQVQERVILE